MIINAREVTYYGRRYLVAHVVMLVPGVLNGSKGPLYYDAAEVANSVSLWNRIAVTVGHPTRQDGTPLSAKSPEVFDRFGLGVINAARIVQGRLEADLWIDVELARRNAPQVLAKLKAGRPLEVSTGLNIDQEPANGIWVNRLGQHVAYTGVARRFRPDHLAILPHQEGACSLRDGCGANRRTIV